MMVSLRPRYAKTITDALKPGFSFTELIFYVAIVAVLLGGAIFGGKKILDKAKKTTTESSLRVIKSAIDTYYNDVQPNRYPETLEDLVNRPQDVRGWEGPYLDVKESRDGEKLLPKDGWSQDFVYERTPGQAHPYELYSWGEHGEDSPQEEWLSAW